MDISRDDLKQAYIDAMKESGRDIDFKSLESLEENLRKLGKQTSENRTSMGGLLKEMVTGRKVYKDFNSTLERLDRQIDELGDATDTSSKKQREELQVRRVAVQQMMQHNAAQKAVVDGLTTFSKTVANTAGRSVGGFVKGLQDGASAFTLAGGLMEGAIDGANAGAQALGGGLATVGTTLAVNTNPRVRGLGLAAAGAGALISGLGNAAAATGKFVVQFMIKEMERTVETYQKISTSGALFSDGMTGMRNSASRAGLTVNQLGEVLGRSSGLFAESGMTVGGATKMIARVGDVMGAGGANSIRSRLLALGYSFQEQTELSAEIMADLRKANSTFIDDPQRIAQATEEYAKNLRTISAITGEDAKKKLEETRRASANVAFRQRLMELDKKFPGTYTKTMTAMSTMTDQQQQNLREMLVFGNVVNQAGAIQTSQSQAMYDEVAGMRNMILNGNLTTEADLKQAQQFQGEKSDQFRKEVEIGRLSAIGMANMVGLYGDVGNGFSAQLLRSDKLSKDGFVRAQNTAELQAEASDQLTNNYKIAAVAAQNLAIELQERILPVLQKFTDYSQKILSELDSQLGKSGVGGESKFSFSNLLSEMLTYGSIGATAGGVIGAGAGGVGAIPGAVIGGTVGAVSGAAGSVYQQLRNSGTKSDHRAGAGTGTGKPDLATISSKSGASAQVGAKFASSFQGLVDFLDASGYKIRSLGGYNDRDVTGKPGVKSIHAHGGALDINPATNPYGPTLITDLPPQIGKIAKSLGLGWGGDWSSVKDAMHFSAANSEGGTQLQAKTGGQFSGPDTGYPVTLHGDEAVVPLPNGRSIPVDLDMSELVTAMRDLIRVAKEQRDYSEKIFQAVQ
jgi:hypothetical protein